VESVTDCCRYRKQVIQTAVDAEKDGVTVPKTLEEYCIKNQPERSNIDDDLDFYDDDDYLDDCEDDCAYESEDHDSDDNDSGNGES